MSKRVSVLLPSKKNDVEGIRGALNGGADVNEVDSKRYTALHWACKLGHTDVVNVLLEHGANAQSIDQYGEWPVFRAVRNGHVSIARSLLAQYGLPGTTPEYYSCNHKASGFLRTQLLLSVLERADIPMAELICEYSLHFDATDDNGQGETLLMRESRRGHDIAVQTLCKLGANLRAADNKGNTALHHAMSKGHLPTIIELITAGCPLDVENSYGRTPMWAAVYYERPEAARLLLDAGVKPMTFGQAEEIQERFYDRLLPSGNGDDDESD